MKGLLLAMLLGVMFTKIGLALLSLVKKGTK